MRSTLMATLLTCAGLALTVPAAACDEAKAKIVNAGATGSGGASATVTTTDGKTVIVCKSDGVSTFTIDKGGKVNVVSSEDSPDSANKIVLISPEGKREISSKAKAFKVVIEGDAEPQVIELSPSEIAEGGAFSIAPNSPQVFQFQGMPKGEFKFKEAPGGAFAFGEGGKAFAFAAPKGEGRSFFRAAPSDNATPAPDRPRLGVMLEENDNGLVINDVMEGLPAAKSGIQQGDIIIEINGASPANMDRLRKALSASEMTVTVLRDGDEIRLGKLIIHIYFRSAVDA